MPKIKLLKKSFEDKRGKIIDVFVKSPKEHCLIVTFKKGAVRGNHYHKKSTQFSFLLSGELDFYFAKVDKKNGKVKKIKKRKIKKNTFITHWPFEAHAFRSRKDSILVAFSCGIRGGSKYEKDTFRLKTKLIPS
jgi:dTDP-4-dehydrorhamnose 3,5-epimerase-like enzyme